MSNTQVVAVMARKKAHSQTGPRSLAGKNRSRWNALKDGASARSSVLPFEDERLYKRHIKEVEGALQPANYVEVQLVREYAEGLWRIARHENRGACAREKILEQITPAMVAQILRLGERYVASAPYYLTDLKYKISARETADAKRALALYHHLLDNVKGIANFNLVWTQFKVLFEAADAWVQAQRTKTTPILNSLRSGLNIAWQQKPELFLEVLDRFSIHLYYVAHFEEFKPEIRIWMEAWYFGQKMEMRHIEHDEQLLLKERNHVYGILDKIARLRKANLYLESLPSSLSLSQSLNKEADIKNEMAKKSDESVT